MSSRSSLRLGVGGLLVPGASRGVGSRCKDRTWGGAMKRVRDLAAVGAHVAVGSSVDHYVEIVMEKPLCCRAVGAEPALLKEGLLEVVGQRSGLDLEVAIGVVNCEDPALLVLGGSHLGHGSGASFTWGSFYCSGGCYFQVELSRTITLDLLLLMQGWVGHLVGRRNGCADEFSGAKLCSENEPVPGPAADVQRVVLSN
eukprot:855329-Rhodomonas_salina.1